VELNESASHEPSPKACNENGYVKAAVMPPRYALEVRTASEVDT